MREYNFKHLTPGDRCEVKPKEIQRLNSILKRELGTLSSYPTFIIGEPDSKKIPGNDTAHYQWEWSENLRREVRTGNKKEVILPSGLVIFEDEVLILRATNAPRNCWLIVKAIGVSSPQQWALSNPNYNYPGSIIFSEVTFGGRLMTSRRPTDDLNQGIIGEIKNERESALTLKEIEESWEKHHKKEMAKGREAFMSFLDPIAPVRWQTPGKRNGGVWQRRSSEEKMIIGG